MMNPKQYKQKLQNQRQRLGLLPGYAYPPNRKAMNREVGADTRYQFRPLYRANAASIRASKQDQKNQHDWYRQYQHMLQHNNAATNQQYAAASQAQGAMNQTAYQQSNQQANAITADMARAQTVQGAAAPTGVAPLRRAIVSRGAIGKDVRASITGGKVNQLAYGRNIKANAAAQSIQARTAEIKNRRSLRQDRMALGKQRGDYAVSLRDKYRAEAQDTYFKNKAFSADAKQNAIQNKETAKQDAVANQNTAIDNAHQARKDALDQWKALHPNFGDKALQRWKNNHPPKSFSGKGPTPAEKHAQHLKNREAGAMLRTNVRQHGAPPGPKAAYDYLISQGVSPKVARRTVKRYYKNRNEGIGGAIGNIG